MVTHEDWLWNRASHPACLSLNSAAKKNGGNLQMKAAGLLDHSQEAISVKGASTYNIEWSLNTYVNKML